MPLSSLSPVVAQKPCMPSLSLLPPVVWYIVDVEPFETVVMLCLSLPQIMELRSSL